MVIAEVALALILVAGAGLMIRSFAQLGAVNPGFVGDQVVTMRTQLPSAEYTEAAWARFYRALIERVQALPGVRSAVVNNGIPMASGGTESGAIPDSRPFEQDFFASALYQAVSGDYFETLGIPLRQGRTFTDQDLEGRPLVAIVDETMAEEFWPGESPIGRRVAFEFAGTQDTPEPIWREVVGVVGHVRHYELRSLSRVQVYVPYGQPPIWFASRRAAMALFVRTDGDPSAVVPALRAEVAALDANLPVYDVQTMNEVLLRQVGTDQLLRGVLTLFAEVALLLAAIGIYGVTSYTVSRRTREIGVRMALGAEPVSVLGLVLRRALLLTGVGLVVGALAAVLLSRLLASVLFEVDATDPVTFATTAAVLAAVAGLASYLPARRAAGVSPVVALRHE